MKFPSDAKAQVTKSAMKATTDLARAGQRPITAKTAIGRKYQGWRNRRLLKKGMKQIRNLNKEYQRSTQGVTKTLTHGLTSTTGQIAAASTAQDLTRKNSYTGSLSSWMGGMDNNPDPSKGASGDSQNDSTTSIGGGWESKI